MIPSPFFVNGFRVLKGTKSSTFIWFVSKWLRRMRIEFVVEKTEGSGCVVVTF
jgi:hypothetical protein